MNISGAISGFQMDIGMKEMDRNMNYLKMFNNMHPGFFDDLGIKGMPKDWVFSELIMDLRNDSPLEVVLPCPEDITFGEYKGDISKLKKSVYEVDEDWVLQHSLCGNCKRRLLWRWIKSLAEMHI